MSGVECIAVLGRPANCCKIVSLTMSAESSTSWAHQTVHSEERAISLFRKELPCQRWRSYCAVNVPREVQSNEVFEVFEATSGSSVRADAGGKRL